MITGVDLIQEQIRAAQGIKLRYKQEDIKIKVTQPTLQTSQPASRWVFGYDRSTDEAVCSVQGLSALQHGM